MLRSRVPFSQMAVAALLGVAGGYYIYRPYFEPVQKSSDQQNQDAPKTDNKTD
ncbi:protein PIGBOS1 [Pungitius pungitius]|uniref:protein PIGBOS1 n=1 Tax=Pungitius pungitius TaxID=134920 RepID=UPI001886C52B|nr:protein PIGBOS1 [Pungitius pungitius]